jgi:iron-sulfur cluster repair protein YtfE (RIC family)
MRIYNLDIDDIYILKNICAYWQFYESAAKYRDMEKKIEYEYSIDRDVILNEIKSLTMTSVSTRALHKVSEQTDSYKKVIDFIIDKYNHKGKEKMIDMLTELLHIGINNNIKYSKEVLLSKMRTIKINSLLDYE